MKRSVLEDWRIALVIGAAIFGLAVVTETGAAGLYLFSIVAIVGFVLWDKHHETPPS